MQFKAKVVEIESGFRFANKQPRVTVEVIDESCSEFHSTLKFVRPAGQFALDQECIVTVEAVEVEAAK